MQNCKQDNFLSLIKDNFGINSAKIALFSSSFFAKISNFESYHGFHSVIYQVFANASVIEMC
jgi:hypothetical protein